MKAVFGESGLLARELEGYRFRPSQLEMAEAVWAAIQAGQSLIAEAGTGTGKTFAYLVPALTSGGKTILSTGTKNLQNQLFHRDIPRLLSLLRLPVTVALLKGRSNYICHHHLKKTLEAGKLKTREEVLHLHQVAAFAARDQKGDRSTLDQIPESSAIWPLVTSTRDNCLGQACTHHAECFVLQARREAMQSDLVVVNHHLLMADVVLKDEGLGELLPQCQTVILDEAHQIPDTASRFFGETLSTTRLLDLARSVFQEAHASGPAGDLAKMAQALEKEVRDLRLAMPSGEARWARRQLTGHHEHFWEGLGRLKTALSGLHQQLDAQGVQAEPLLVLGQRTASLLDDLRRWTEGEEGSADKVFWAEGFTHSLHLHATPLKLGELLGTRLQATPKSWIFVSATLSVGGDFSHFQKEMGLENVAAQAWESPFDYPAQALLYVPHSLPEPGSSSHASAVVDAALPILVANGGRAFLLFTSHRALIQARERIREQFAILGCDFPLLVQGERDRSQLLDQFRASGHAVLLGTGAFWEGVDVKGDALSLVIIDKLPFDVPDDPVLAARLEDIQRQGGNAFMDYQLPRAIMALRQGAGRLIRDEQDRGVLMICDPRLVEKPYGRKIWRSLPPMIRTREREDVIGFLERNQPS